jgi:hypothetical protein
LTQNRAFLEAVTARLVTVGRITAEEVEALSGGS